MRMTTVVGQRGKRGMKPGADLNKYVRDHYRSFSLRYNRVKDADIIAWLLEVGDYKGYITRLIRADMGSRRRRKKK